MNDDKQPSNVIVLENSLAPLRNRFNHNSEQIRFIALLSPTCPLWRDKGARAVCENVLEKFPTANISVLIVWIPILAEDTFDSAIQPIKFLSDNRIHHFYDNDRMAGKSIAESVGWTGNIAWDIYLFYEPLTEWRDKPPEPKYWMHQLPDEWATKGKFRTGVDLANELFVSMQKLNGSSSSRW